MAWNSETLKWAPETYAPHFLLESPGISIISSLVAGTLKTHAYTQIQASPKSIISTSTPTPTSSASPNSSTSSLPPSAARPWPTSSPAIPSPAEQPPPPRNPRELGLQ